MHNLVFARVAVFALCSAAWFPASHALAQEPAPVIQTQANPRGSGMPAETPPNPSTAATPVPPAMPADSSYQAGPYKGALTPPPPEAQGKSYPLCTRNLQDSCVNPGEAATRPVRASHKGRHSHRN